jgi:hypothetical protein
MRPGIRFERRQQVDDGAIYSVVTHRDRHGLEREIASGYEGPAPLSRGSHILWWIDLRAEGDGVPDSFRQARTWFDEHAQAFLCALNAEADNTDLLGIDSDSGVRLVSFEVDPAAGINGELRYWANSVQTGRNMPEVLRGIARDWYGILARLIPRTEEGPDMLM